MAYGYQVHDQLGNIIYNILGILGLVKSGRKFLIFNF